MKVLPLGELRLKPPGEELYWITVCDPVSKIIALNIHRRHLTKQQQADLIVAARKAAAEMEAEAVRHAGHANTPVSTGGLPTVA